MWKKLILTAALLIAFGSGGTAAYLKQNPTVPTPFFEQQKYTNGAVESTPKPALPQMLSIPKIGVLAEIEEVGLDVQKRMDVPQIDQNVGWYKYGAKPGDSGNAVITGHLDSPGGPSVFYNLQSLSENDELVVTDREGKEYVFVVTRVESYPENAFPMEDIFGSSEDHNLKLITCEGVYDRTRQSYSDRLVVHAVLKVSS